MSLLRKLKIKNVTASCRLLDKTGTHTHLPGRDRLSAFSFSSFYHTWAPADIVLAAAGQWLTMVTVIYGDSPCSEAVNQFSRNAAYGWHLGHLDNQGLKLSAGSFTDFLWEMIQRQTQTLSQHHCNVICFYSLSMVSHLAPDKRKILTLCSCYHVISGGNVDTKNCNGPLIRTFVFSQRNIWPVSMSWWITH